MFDIDYGKIARDLNELQGRTVLVQIPEGLKTRAVTIVHELKKRTEKEVYTVIEPCFGACDLADEKAKKVKADILVHFGHNELTPPEIKTLFYPLNLTFDMRPAIDKVAVLMKENGIKKVGLTATSQYTAYLGGVGDLLESKGFEAFIGKGTSRVKDLGQVLGCNYSSAHAIEKDVDCVLFFGDGMFHPIGIAFSANKKVFVANPLTDEAKEITQEKDVFLRKRFAILSQCSKATKFGILVSTKKGQNRIELAKKLKNLVEETGKNAFIFVSDYIYPEYLRGINVDCYVNTACPRLAYENFAEFDKLIINPNELEIALNRKHLNSFGIDEIE